MVEWGERKTRSHSASSDKLLPRHTMQRLLLQVGTYHYLSMHTLYSLKNTQRNSTGCYNSMWHGLPNTKLLADPFFVACMRLYKPPCQSVGLSSQAKFRPWFTLIRTNACRQNGLLAANRSVTLMGGVTSKSELRRNISDLAMVFTTIYRCKRCQDEKNLWIMWFSLPQIVLTIIATSFRPALPW